MPGSDRPVTQKDLDKLKELVEQNRQECMSEVEKLRRELQKMRGNRIDN
jgi:hypothetical protein